MEILVNGTPCTLNRSQTVSAWLEDKLLTKGVAIAVNERVIPRQHWDEQTLQAGDRIEIIHPLQGG